MKVPEMLLPEFITRLRAIADGLESKALEPTHYVVFGDGDGEFDAGVQLQYRSACKVKP